MAREKRGAYGRAIRSALEQAQQVAGGRLSAEQVEPICRDLLAAPAAHRQLYLRNSRRCRRPEVVQRLIAASREVVHCDAREALRRAEAAVSAADALPVEPPLAALGSDLRCEARVCLADALRVHGQLRRAEAEIGMAVRAATLGSGDALLWASLRRARGSLRRDLGQFEGAQADLEGAAADFHRLGELHVSGMTLLALGYTQYMAGNSSAAFHSTLEAGARLDPELDPMMNLGLLHSQFLYLADLGEDRLALGLLGSFAHLYSLLGAEVLELRARWAVGRLFLDRERWGQAMAQLEPVRRELAARGLTFDAALAGLDLALAYAGARRPLEVRKLALEMYDVFFSEAVPREAWATLTLFVKAADELRADLGLMRQWLQALEPLRRCPPPPAEA